MSQLEPSAASACDPVLDCEFLAGVEPFTVFPERWLSLMTGLMRSETYQEDEMIFRASDVSDAIFVIRRGKVVLFTDTVGEPVQLTASLSSGSVFGEVGVLERSRRRVSARATCETEVLRLDAADLGKLARASRRFGARLAQCALLRYMKDKASMLELGQRSDVRIRIDQEVVLKAAKNEPTSAVLDNLSIGGACLRAVPESWNLTGAERISLGLDEQPQLLVVEARTAWRKGSSLGLAFTGRSADHDTRVDAAIELLLKEAPSSSEVRVS